MPAVMSIASNTPTSYKEDSLHLETEATGLCTVKKKSDLMSSSLISYSW